MEEGGVTENPPNKALGVNSYFEKKNNDIRAFDF